MPQTAARFSKGRPVVPTGAVCRSPDDAALCFVKQGTPVCKKDTPKRKRRSCRLCPYPRGRALSVLPRP